MDKSIGDDARPHQVLDVCKVRIQADKCLSLTVPPLRDIVIAAGRAAAASCIVVRESRPTWFGVP